MKLESVSLHDVRGIGTVDIDLAPALAEGRPFFITGPAGSGKTSVLEAITAAKEAAAPYGLPPQRSAFRDHQRPDGRIVLRWRVAPERQPIEGAPSVVTTTWSLSETSPSDMVRTPSLRAALGDYSRDDARFKVEYFHSGRAFDPADALTQGPSDDGAKRLSRDARKYTWIRRYLITPSAPFWRNAARGVDPGIAVVGPGAQPARGPASGPGSHVALGMTLEGKQVLGVWSGD